MLKTKKGISIIKKIIKTHTRSKNTSCKVNNSFMLKFVLLKPSFTSINCNPPHRGRTGGRIGTRFLRPRGTSPLKGVNPGV